MITDNQFKEILRAHNDIKDNYDDGDYLEVFEDTLDRYGTVLPEFIHKIVTEYEELKFRMDGLEK